jgi:hypothetical protein
LGSAAPAHPTDLQKTEAHIETVAFGTQELKSRCINIEVEVQQNHSLTIYQSPRISSSYRRETAFSWESPEIQIQRNKCSPVRVSMQQQTHRC